MASELVGRLQEWLPLTKRTRVQSIYKYGVLEPDEIRTLLVQPGASGSPLTGQIEQHKLGDPDKPYEALSYVWGSPKRGNVVEIGEKGVLVTQNAKELLLHLRDEHHPRRVWIDGICIDQDNLDERSHQVTLMQAIFSGASSVLIWVGESDQDTESIFSFFTLMDKRRRAEAEPNEGENGHPDTEFVRKSIKDPSKVRKFASRPWFRRSWTFQEACLSAESYLVCGKHQLHWRIFISATLYLTSTGMLNVFGQSADTIVALANLAAANPDHQTPYLSVILPLTRELQAASPHDKIFSVLGMADQKNMPSLDLSYSLPVSEVYARTAKAMIAQEQGLSVLLPSWVPDWNLSRPAAYFHGYDWPNTTHLYDINEGASFPNDIPNDLGPETHVLKLRGARLDVITHVCDGKKLLLETVTLKGRTHKIAARSANGEMNLLRKELDKIPLKLGFSLLETYKQTREEIIQALVRTLTADRGGIGGEGGGKWFTDSRDSRLMGVSMRMQVPLRSRWLWAIHGNEPNPDVTQQMSVLTIALWTFMAGRKVFRTHRGLLGISAEGTKVGDEVWDIVGGQVPFVLRPKKTKIRETPGVERVASLQVVGEAYVHGVMKGELWKRVEEETTPQSSHYPGALHGAGLEFEDLELV
ncbi:unnamed protein product [Clonostachys rosea]|uniref:Heterokaryon incompatibility domain-containing protein n=1 Tax=Bionectria ochroleuca TaxID=29856 RepID=A0ABY6URX5_BIOOC|nr:unnamed protein product [Clonostachys rosea]